MDFIEKFLEEKDLNFRRSLMIDTTNIKDVLSKASVDFFDIHWIYIDAKDKVAKAERYLERTRFSLEKSLNKQVEQKLMEGQKVKKLTKDQIESRIKTHPKFIDAQDNLDEAISVAEFLKVKYSAIKERNDLLKELTKYKSSELYTGLTFKK
jgi:hypothetical protein